MDYLNVSNFAGLAYVYVMFPCNCASLILNSDQLAAHWASGSVQSETMSDVYQQFYRWFKYSVDYTIPAFVSGINLFSN